MNTTLTEEQQDLALDIVARWLGKKGLGQASCNHPEFTRMDFGYPIHGDDLLCPAPEYGPAPTGRDAAMQALGPQLIRDWDWPSSGPTPTVLLEGGPYDWAVDISLDRAAFAEFTKIGVLAEPYAGYALCLYPY